MTAPLQHPNRRWLKPTVFVGLITATCWCAWIVIRDAGLDSRVDDWTMLAREKEILFADQTLCIIPGWETNPVGRLFLGRREVLAVALRSSDVDALLSMPACPVHLKITTGRNVSVSEVQSLRDRFGAAVE